MPESLLARVAAGDVGAVEACLDRYGGLVWSLANRLLADAVEAEDAVQDIFVELWRKADRYDASIASEATFIATLARRRLIDRRRRRQVRPDTTAVPLDEGATQAEIAPDQAVERSDEAARAAAALSHLTPPQQQALKLSIYQGWTCQHIADHLRQPLGTVKTNIRRGLIRLRELLDAPAPAGAKEAAS